MKRADQVGLGAAAGEPASLARVPSQNSLAPSPERRLRLVSSTRPSSSKALSSSRSGPPPLSAAAAAAAASGSSTAAVVVPGLNDVADHESGAVAAIRPNGDGMRREWNFSLLLLHREARVSLQYLPQWVSLFIDSVTVREALANPLWGYNANNVPVVTPTLTPFFKYTDTTTGAKTKEEEEGLTEVAKTITLSYIRIPHEDVADKLASPTRRGQNSSPARGDSASSAAIGAQQAHGDTDQSEGRRMNYPLEDFCKLSVRYVVQDRRVKSVDGQRNLRRLQVGTKLNSALKVTGCPTFTFRYTVVDKANLVNDDGYALGVIIGSRGYLFTVTCHANSGQLDEYLRYVFLPHYLDKGRFAPDRTVSYAPCPYAQLTEQQELFGELRYHDRDASSSFSIPMHPMRIRPDFSPTQTVGVGSIACMTLELDIYQRLVDVDRELADMTGMPLHTVTQVVLFLDVEAVSRMGYPGIMSIETYSKLKVQRLLDIFADAKVIGLPISLNISTHTGRSRTVTFSYEPMTTVVKAMLVSTLINNMGITAMFFTKLGGGMFDAHIYLYQYLLHTLSFDDQTKMAQVTVSRFQAVNVRLTEADLTRAYGAAAVGAAAGVRDVMAQHRAALQASNNGKVEGGVVVPVDPALGGLGVEESDPARVAAAVAVSTRSAVLLPLNGDDSEEAKVVLLPPPDTYKRKHPHDAVDGDQSEGAAEGGSTQSSAVKDRRGSTNRRESLDSAAYRNGAHGGEGSTSSRNTAQSGELVQNPSAATATPTLFSEERNGSSSTTGAGNGNSGAPRGSFNSASISISDIPHLQNDSMWMQSVTERESEADRGDNANASASNLLTPSAAANRSSRRADSVSDELQPQNDRGAIQARDVPASDASGPQNETVVKPSLSVEALPSSTPERARSEDAPHSAEPTDASTAAAVQEDGRGAAGEGREGSEPGAAAAGREGGPRPASRATLPTSSTEPGDGTPSVSLGRSGSKMRLIVTSTEESVPPAQSPLGANGPPIVPRGSEGGTILSPGVHTTSATATPQGATSGAAAGGGGGGAPDGSTPFAARQPPASPQQQDAEIQKALEGGDYADMYFTPPLYDMYVHCCDMQQCRPNSYLLKKLPRNPRFTNNVEELDLTSNYLGRNGFVALLQFLEHIPRLHTVVFNDMSLDNADVENLCEILARLPTVNTLSLRNNTRVTLPATRHLTKLLRANRNITTVLLDGTSIGESLIQKIQSEAAKNAKSEK